MRLARENRTPSAADVYDIRTNCHRAAATPVAVCVIACAKTQQGELMTAQMIMNTDMVTLSQGDTFGKAFEMMVDRHISSLPVVDAQGLYKGMVDLYDVWQVLLPKAATLDSEFMQDLSFISGSKDKLKEKLEEAAARPVSEFLDGKEITPIHPDTPVQEAIMLLFRRGGCIPVIDKQSHKLLGIVAPWEILDPLR
jgi:CBS domain-containing protein